MMNPVDAVTFLVTPKRWACAVDRVTTKIGAALVPDTTHAGQALSRLSGALSPVRSLALRAIPGTKALDWKVRQGFWSLTWSATVALQLRPTPPSIPRDEKPIALLSAPETYPDFQAPSLVVPADMPCAEKSTMAEFAVQMIQLLQDVYPVDATHQPVASSDPRERLDAAYTRLHRAVRPPPVWHDDLVAATQENNLLGVLAAGGPFAKLLERVEPESDSYVIDLKHLAEYPVRAGLCHLGSEIQLVAAGGALRVCAIAYQGEDFSPGKAGWELAERIALAGLVTHVTVWRQGMEYHVGGLAPVAVVTHNYLRATHPVRRLLAAHMAQTMLVNHSTHLTLRRSGWDARQLSFTTEGLLRYYDDGASGFDIRRLDVAADAQRRGIPETLDYPYLPQALRLYGTYESYVREYVEHHYPDEASLQADTQAQVWFECLDRTIANGVRALVPALSKDDLVKLCTLIIYSVSVGHTENSLWNYAPFMPTSVRMDGTRQSVGEVQSTLDFQFLVGPAGTLLQHDLSPLALDAKAGRIMDGFQAALRDLQSEMQTGPSRYWHLYPRELAASVQA